MTTEFNYNTKSKALKAVKRNGGNLRLCTPEFQNNEDVVMTAIKKNHMVFQHASDELKSNKTFIMKALNEGVYHWGLIKHANATIQSDIDVITLELENSDDGMEFSYAQGETALNKELAAKAIVK